MKLLTFLPALLALTTLHICVVSPKKVKASVDALIALQHYQKFCQHTSLKALRSQQTTNQPQEPTHLPEHHSYGGFLPCL
jgi:hypothetical protein